MRETGYGKREQKGKNKYGEREHKGKREGVGGLAELIFGHGGDEGEESDEDISVDSVAVCFDEVDEECLLVRGWFAAERCAKEVGDESFGVSLGAGVCVCEVIEEDSRVVAFLGGEGVIAGGRFTGEEEVENILSDVECGGVDPRASARPPRDIGGEEELLSHEVEGVVEDAEGRGRVCSWSGPRRRQAARVI